MNKETREIFVAILGMLEDLTLILTWKESADYEDIDPAYLKLRKKIQETLEKIQDD